MPLSREDWHHGIPVPHPLMTVAPGPLGTLRKHVMRVYGSVFLEEESADLVRIEGELSKRPSIWTRKVEILREYSRIDGVHVPVAMSSKADVLVVGASTFSMTYTYVEINGRQVLSHWDATQFGNGEWGYRQPTGYSNRGRLSMTLAGVASEFVARDWLTSAADQAVVVDSVLALA